MLGYFSKRILLIIPSVMLVILLIFILMAALPGTDTARMVSYADSQPGEAPQSFLQQYGQYCFRVFFRQDFGSSRLSVLPLRQELGIRTGITLRVMGISVLAAYLLGVPLGMYAACRQGSWQDSLITGVTTLLSAIPAFCLSLALMLIFAVQLQWIHVIPQNAVDEAVPVAILSIVGTAGVAKVARAGAAEVLEKPFVVSLTSLGLSRRSVLWKHVLKNALIPAFSVFSTQCAQLLCGSIVVERFFSIRGLGSAMISSIRSRDTTALLGCAVMVAVIMCVCGVITDLLYVLVRPSLRRSLGFGSTLRRGSGR